MPDRRAPTWLSAVVRLRCPRCRTGALFPKGTFAFSEPFEMHTHCPRCGLDYWPEPGFYYGAMFLSYILFCFPFLGFVLLLRFGFGWSIGRSMLLLCLLAAFGFVYIFRVSRAVWLSANVKYDRALADEVAARSV